MVIIYKTTSTYEVSQVKDDDYYDVPITAIDAVDYWWEPSFDTLVDTFYGDPGFQVEIFWFLGGPPVLYFNS